MFITMNHAQCFPLVIGVASSLAALQDGDFKYEIKIKEGPPPTCCITLVSTHMHLAIWTQHIVLFCFFFKCCFVLLILFLHYRGTHSRVETQ